MGHRKNLSELLGYFLDKKDYRTINKLEDTHPLLFELFKMIGEDKLNRYIETSSMGYIDRAFGLSEEELSQCIGSILTESEKRNMQIELDIKKVYMHVYHETLQKLENFYAQKLDGEGLREILKGSLSKVVIDNSHMPIQSKEILLRAIEQYKTSLKRLEVPNHKKILMEFVRHNISDYGCEILIMENKK